MAQTSVLTEAGGQPDKLRALGVISLNGMFGEYDSLGVIQQALELLPDDLALVSSFGADSAVLLHLLSQVDKNVPVLFLETGKHFAETLEYVETLKSTLGLTNVRALTPDAADITRFDPNGDLWETDPDSCCHIRKTEPLNADLGKFGGWITGRKRFQTSDRGVLPHFELTSDDRIKVNPLAYWTNDDVEAYKQKHDLPDHPLYKDGFKSIGCAPCTSAVAEGEDPRSGRWRGVDKTECGIHFDFNSKIAKPVSASSLTLFKDGAFGADPWRDWVDGDEASLVRYTHVPLTEFIRQRDAFLASPHPLGLLVEAGDRVEEVADVLQRFSSVAISFPAFTDGRGYSAARLLSERYGYTGELRAIGDVLQDQIPYMQRCGINAFVVTHEPTRKALENNALPGVSVYMQPFGSSTEVPLGTRPFLRKASQVVPANGNVSA